MMFNAPDRVGSSRAMTMVALVCLTGCGVGRIEPPSEADPLSGETGETRPGIWCRAEPDPVFVGDAYQILAGDMSPGWSVRLRISAPEGLSVVDGLTDAQGEIRETRSTSVVGSGSVQVFRLVGQHQKEQLAAECFFSIVESPVCGDNVCAAGEDCTSCPADCGACGSACGDNVCAADEDCASCPADCGACVSTCGDNVCAAAEDCTSCPADCGACGPKCGDGTCDVLESCASCETDCGSCGGQDTLRVPQDFSTIQAAVDAANDGDLVLVAPGVYRENVTISSQSVIVASELYTTGDPVYIDQTIVDGNGGSFSFDIRSPAGSDTALIGLTIQNSDDGITSTGFYSVLSCQIRDTTDGIDFEGGGALVRDSVFENNSDDGLDLDGATSAVIMNNIIRYNSGDGVEMRLHEYSGPTLEIVFEGNTIVDNDCDGIQFIDYDDSSDRTIRVSHNLIAQNGQAGIGVMDNGDTNEDFRAAPMPERLVLSNNTIVANEIGVSGGGNVIAVNNLFSGNSQMQIKDVLGVVAYSLFNGTVGSGDVDDPTTVTGDPLLDANYGLSAGSPAIDAGTALFVWNGNTIVSIPADGFVGSAPDIGFVELDSF